MLLVDFINPLRFPGAETLAAPAVAAARQTRELKRRLAERGVPAIYANDNYGIWHSEFRGLLETCQRCGGAAAELAELLAPGPDDLTVLKPRHSAFHGTPLHLLLDSIGARELVLVGLAADICVQFSAMDAYVRGYSLRVPCDCTAAEAPGRKQAALDWMGLVLGACVAPAHRLP